MVFKKQGTANNGAAAGAPETTAEQYVSKKKSQQKSLTRVVFTKLRDFASPHGFPKHTSSTERRRSSELGFIFHGGLLHAQAGTVRTTTAASDLETTAYFLGQLRDYVHLKSSEEGRQGGVEPRPCLSFVPIGPT